MAIDYPTTDSDRTLLIVIDMQNDFVTGPLGTPEAQAIIPKVVKKISTAPFRCCTKDTHKEDYLDTPEGRKLPVLHCISGTPGHDMIPEIAVAGEMKTFCKSVFGSDTLAETVKSLYQFDYITTVELIGVCTDICVITNALLIKTYCPQIEVVVDASCCAGTTPERHESALSVMKSCQITVINEEKIHDKTE